MTDELNEIIRVLQLTTYDEEEWDADNLTVMKKAQNAIEGKVRAARDWLEVWRRRKLFKMEFGFTVVKCHQVFCLKVRLLCDNVQASMFRFYC
jgi:hypothetical protein